MYDEYTHPLGGWGGGEANAVSCNSRSVLHCQTVAAADCAGRATAALAACIANKIPAGHAMSAWGTLTVFSIYRYLGGSVIKTYFLRNQKWYTYQKSGNTTFGVLGEKRRTDRERVVPMAR